MNIVFLNGPPRVGKDTVGKNIARLSDFNETASFAAELKDATHRAFGLTVPTNHFERRKDVPAAEFLMETPRNVYIAFSERFMKPLYGPGVFGRMLVTTLRSMAEAGCGLAAITDSGFREEADEVLKVFPNALLIRLHREGCDFRKDSRSHIQLPIESVDMRNDDILAPRTVAAFVDGFFNPPSDQ